MHLRFSVVLMAGLATLFVLGCKSGQDESIKEVTADNNNSGDSDTEIPKPSESGPHPKAVVDDTVHNFGTMKKGDEGVHQFVIRNEGEAPLQLYANPKETTCQCTVGKLKRNLLQPGEETEVEVSWHIGIPGPAFSHSALVRTNDPEKTEIRLLVRGWVGQLLGTVPTGDWSFGTVKDEGIHEVSGILFSNIADDFEITKIEPSSPLLTPEWKRLQPKDLESIAGQSPSDDVEKEEDDGGKSEDKDGKKDSDDLSKPPAPKCGYKITAKLAPGCPIGNFREELEVFTTAGDNATTTIYIGGRRPGPIQIIGMPGVFWYEPEMLLRFRRFEASAGTSGTASIFMENVPEGLKLEIAEVHPEVVKVEIQKDPAFKALDRTRFLLKIQVSPGAEPLALNAENYGKILLKSNHPKAETIPINLELVSY